MHRAGADDEALWRDIGWTEFWKNDLWIIPIHRLAPAAHWTLAVVYLKHQPQQIAYFDSLASLPTWEADAQVSLVEYSATLSAHQELGLRNCTSLYIDCIVLRENEDTQLPTFAQSPGLRTLS